MTAFCFEINGMIHKSASLSANAWNYFEITLSIHDDSDCSGNGHFLQRGSQGSIRSLYLCFGAKSRLFVPFLNFYVSKPSSIDCSECIYQRRTLKSKNRANDWMLIG
jgi:hypothetical protein